MVYLDIRYEFVILKSILFYHHDFFKNILYIVSILIFIFFFIFFFPRCPFRRTLNFLIN